ncbi:MAG: TRAP transporter small permease [Deltaproteobacteria bacterium]|nr:TRAP transporter small permease [Deltaproteobacteria bacterium]
MTNKGENGLYARIRRFAEVSCGIILFVAVTISMAEIIARVVFKVSFDLFFDFSVWLTVWALLLITGFLLPGGGHVSIDFIRDRFSGWGRWALEVGLALITLAYGAFITWGSILFLQQLHVRGSIFPRYIPVPKWIVELCVPLGMGIFTLIALAELVRAARKKW